MAWVGERVQDRRRKPVPKRRTFWVILGSAVGLASVAGFGALAVWNSAQAARSDLSAAIPLATELASSVVDGDTELALATVDELHTLTSSAREHTQGFAWRMYEWVPWLGNNLTAVRTLTEVVDDLVDEVARPAAEVSIADLMPRDGTFDLEALEEFATFAGGTEATVVSAQDRLATIGDAGLIDQVSAGVDEVSEKVDEVAVALHTANAVLSVLPDALGAQEPKSYLLLFQNNGEVTPAGGTVGSLAQVDVVAGRVSLGTQSSAAPEDIPLYGSPIVELPADSLATYPYGLGMYAQSLTRTPRFELTYSIAREMWWRKTGITVDGVAAIDAVVLQRLIAATGPVESIPGVTLTADNVLPLLLGDLYYTYSPAEVDEINQGIAGIVFKTVMAGEVDPIAFLDLLRDSALERRVLLWTDDPTQQDLLRGSDFDGTPPESTHAIAGFGVYFIDLTPGKMQRFQQQQITVSTPSCTPDGRREVVVRVALTNDVDPAIALGLPDYVTGLTQTKGTIKEGVLVYAPLGYTFNSVDVDGRPPAEQPALTTDGSFVVAQAHDFIGPRETRTFTFRFTAPEADTRAIELDVTPVVNPTKISVTTAGC